MSGSLIALHVEMSINYEEYAADRTKTETFALALGWFSVALAVAEILAPRQVCKLIGAPSNERTTATLRTHGAREFANGMAILAQPREATWLWSRAGGDALDLLTLGAAAGHRGANGARLCFASIAVTGIAVLDVLAAVAMSRQSGAPGELGAIIANEVGVTIKAPLEAAEAAWIDWCATGRSTLKGDYAVRFEPAPGARGTEVRLTGGKSKGNLREELRQFKQLLETGDIQMSDGPGLSRAAQPRDSAQAAAPAEVRR